MSVRWISEVSMGEWVRLGVRIGFRDALGVLDILLNDLFNKMGVWN